MGGRMTLRSRRQSRFPGCCAAKRSRPANWWPRTFGQSPSTRSSTRSSPRASTGAGQGRRGRRGPSRPGSRSDCCTGCRSPTRTWSRRAGVRTTFGSPHVRDNVPDRRRADHGPDGRRRGDHDRQDQRARVRGGLAHVQPAVRRDQEPVRPRAAARAAAAAAPRPRWPRHAPDGDGSDMGGSLRNPAVLQRGRVPPVPGPGAGLAAAPTAEHDGRQRADGPDRRRRRAAAVRAGRPDPRSPLALDTPADPAPPRRWSSDPRGLRVASPRTCGAARSSRSPSPSSAGGPGVRCLGARSPTPPRTAGADEVFRTLRAWNFEHPFGALLNEQSPAVQGPTLPRNIDPGRALTGRRPGPGRAAAHGQLFRPRAAVLRPLRHPAAARQPGAAVRRRAGVPRSTACRRTTYLDWMASAYLISATGCPRTVSGRLQPRRPADRRPARRPPPSRLEPPRAMPTL